MSRSLLWTGLALVTHLNTACEFSPQDPPSKPASSPSNVGPEGGPERGRDATEDTALESGPFSPDAPDAPDAPDGDEEGGGTLPGDPNGPGGSPVNFTSLGRFGFDENGNTETITIDFPEPQNTLAIRVDLDRESAGETPCLQLHSVESPGMDAWVSDGSKVSDWGSYYASGPQRVHVGFGTGFYVFPNHGRDFETSFTQVSFRVGLRDCEIFFPRTVSEQERAQWVPEVSFFASAAPEAAAPSELQLAFVVHVPELLGEETLEGTSFLREAFQKMAEYFSVGNIQARLAFLGESPSLTSAPIRYASTNREKLDAIYNQTMSFLEESLEPTTDISTLVPVHFVPCLQREEALTGQLSEPDATVTRLPGGFEAKGYADGIFIRALSCAPSPELYWPSPRSLGKVLAHELGHYLGLYHSIDSAGHEDHLPDTDENNLMHYAPLQIAKASFSSAQFHVMKCHPLLVAHEP